LAIAKSQPGAYKHTHEVSFGSDIGSIGGPSGYSHDCWNANCPEAIRLGVAKARGEATRAKARADAAAAKAKAADATCLVKPISSA